MAIIDRVREITATESDDYFTDDTILFYVNRAQNKVVSFVNSQEIASERSFRVLDPFRRNSSLSLSAGTEVDSYFRTDVNFPADLKDYRDLVYEDTVTLRELPPGRLYGLQWDNTVPTKYEGYYYVLNDGTNKKFRLYLHEDPNTNSLDLYYIKEPTEVQSADNSFTELPDELENAVFYAAAYMLMTQELSQQAPLFSEQYNEELQKNLF